MKHLIVLLIVLSSFAQVHAEVVPLTWTAPGDDGNVGTATTYDFRYAQFPLTEANWNDSGVLMFFGAPLPEIAGTTQTASINLPHGTWFIALKTADEVPNWSGISNIKQVIVDTTIVIPDTIPPAAIMDLR